MLIIPTHVHGNVAGLVLAELVKDGLEPRKDIGELPRERPLLWDFHPVVTQPGTPGTSNKNRSLIRHISFFTNNTSLMMHFFFNSELD